MLRLIELLLNLLWETNERRPSPAYVITEHASGPAA